MLQVMEEIKNLPKPTASEQGQMTKELYKELTTTESSTDISKPDPKESSC
jgi:hypothetical protein